MLNIPAWLLVVPILGFLVFVHELGHFLTAKKFGIKVTEFGFGFPPRIYGYKHGETIYSINWIPIGGFVKMVGEEESTDPRSFARQNAAKRAIVLLAGPIMNLVVPIIIFTSMLALPHNTVVGTVVVSGVAPGSPANLAGIKSGDSIVSINDNRVENHSSLIREIQKNLGQPIKVVIRKGSNVGSIGSSPEFQHVEEINLIPRKKPPSLLVVETVENLGNEVSIKEAREYNRQVELGQTLTQGAIGVMIGTQNPKVKETRLPIWEALPSSFNKIVEVLSLTTKGFTNWATEGDNPGLAGPIGIAQVTGEVAGMGIAPLLELMALISISLAIINILPIPALDGGRLLFIIIEQIRGGKRVSSKVESLVHMSGFIILIGGIILMSYFDIIRLISGNKFLQ